MDFHQIEVGQTIHQATRSDFADTAKIIGVNFINVAFGKLLGSGWYTVEHLIGLAEVMNRAENEIESIPILLDPFSASPAGFRIVIELNAGTNLHVRIFFSKPIEFVEIDAGVITVVIGECDIGD